MKGPVKFKTRNGFPQFARKPGGQPVTLEFVNRLRESDVDEYVREYRRMARRAQSSPRDEPEASSLD